MGTSKIEENLNNGIDVILVIEYKGAFKVKELMGEDSILIFLLPPSLEILEERLRQRGSDSEDMIKNRMNIANVEIEESKKYDYRVVNDDIKKTIEEIKNIVKKEKEN